MKENTNMINRGSICGTETQQNMDLLSQILLEKENYIVILEDELGEMRKDLDGLREKLISFEVGNLDKTMTTNSCTGHIGTRSQQFFPYQQQYKRHHNGTSTSIFSGSNPQMTMSTNLGTLERNIFAGQYCENLMSPIATGERDLR